MFWLNLLCFIGYFVLWFFILFFYFLLTPKGRLPYFVSFRSKTNIIDSIFDFLKMLTNDIKTKDPDYFKPHGIVIYEGRQGSGKTLSMVYDTLRLLDNYPKCKCIGNLGTVYRDRSIDDLVNWKQLVSFNNGIYGVIVQIDELQTWAYSRDFKNADPNILGIVCQNRKNRRIILGTAQKFSLIDKTIRIQVTELRSAFTILGCISGYIRKEPIMDVDGEVKKYRFRGIRLFVHSTELRDAYDTYKVIEKFKKTGFEPRKDT